MNEDSEFKPYDPTWLVELGLKYSEDYPWLADAFSRCRRARPESKFYTHFVDPAGPKWKLQQTITVTHELEGDLVIDILEDNRIGGIEFLTKLIKAQ